MIATNWKTLITIAKIREENLIKSYSARKKPDTIGPPAGTLALNMLEF